MYTEVMPEANDYGFTLTSLHLFLAFMTPTTYFSFIIKTDKHTHIHCGHSAKIRLQFLILQQQFCRNVETDDKCGRLIFCSQFTIHWRFLEIYVLKRLLAKSLNRCVHHKSSNMDIKEIHGETVPDAKLTKSGYDEEPASKRRKRARINFTRPQVYVVYERM